MAALDSMGPKAKRITPIFITIDPARDTVETIKSYVENFGPRLVGLTGTADEIAAAAKAYRVYYAKAGDVSSPDYLMDHSSIIYLMDPNGKFIKHFTYTTDAAKLADDLSEAVANSP
jgi:cytochrome oxidase Cu insertion factor (SCO1/SenC/PrrC family)